MPVVEYPKVEINFTPPSHVLKIVEKAKDEEGSDWSEEEPVYVLKDGKKGTYIMKNQKYFLAETVKENKKKRLRKKLTTKKKEEEKNDFKEVSVIMVTLRHNMMSQNDVTTNTLRHYVFKNVIVLAFKNKLFSFDVLKHLLKRFFFNFKCSL